MRDHYSDMDNSRNCHTSDLWILRRTVPGIPAAIPARTAPRIPAVIPVRTKRRIAAGIPARTRHRTPAGTIWITAAEINILKL